MCFRFCFTLFFAWKFKKALKEYVADKNNQITQITECDFSALQAQGIQAVAFDFDGVLTAHGGIVPDSETQACLKQVVRLFGRGRVFILSNKPNKKRRQYFKGHFPEIEFILAPKKPFPQGLHQILQKTRLSAEAIVLFDDRLLTGVLAGLLAGICVKWVVTPKIDLAEKPIVERFFRLLRKIENMAFSEKDFA